MRFITLTMLSFTQYSAPNTIKECCYIDKNRNQTFCPNVIFNITSNDTNFCPNVIFDITFNDIVEKNKKNTEVARREPYYDKKRNISVNIFNKV